MTQALPLGDSCSRVTEATPLSRSAALTVMVLTPLTAVPGLTTETVGGVQSAAAVTVAVEVVRAENEAEEKPGNEVARTPASATTTAGVQEA